MKKSLTTQEKLNRLSKFAVYYCVIAPLILIGACIGFVFALRSDSGRHILIYSGILIIYSAFIIVFASKIGKIRQEYEKESAMSSSQIVRSVIWHEIWDDYRHDGFELFIRFDKVIYADRNENSIDFSFSLRGHEFNLMVDEDAVSLIADDETDHPTETETPLSSILSLDDFYEFINSFTERICGSKA